MLARRTPETVRRWVWSGRLVARRHGNRLLVPREDVLRLSRGDRTGVASLRAWAAEAASMGRCGNPGQSAADLVINDRRTRSDADARS